MARILLTEDDEAVRSFVKRALELDGHSVDVAEDGGEAVETLTREKGEFDLLVSDIKMPVMDGIALALQTARDFPDMPILLMTGFADQRERANGLDALVHDVITKPFSLVDIRKTVRNAIAGELPQETRRYA
ncbi:response regulator [Roseibium album]|uniref:Mycobacterial persistence regulator A n=1 Tax=Roseibium album TaxID=311410 RepID=A0A0M6Z905_9HYPH|nr:response regulator [Roseibium album]CTQ58582.1 Mycobacterial persistence regulator A [Roseibium album]CTQ66864.1 Mycobacterial persistence regulator A [Roseibium album]CTQ72023.1 Mycobacterial persistence regulator A [Roseibium album]